MYRGNVRHVGDYAVSPKVNRRHHSRSKMGEEEEPTLRIHARVVESVGFARQRDVRSDLAERQLGAPRG